MNLRTTDTVNKNRLKNVPFSKENTKRNMVFFHKRAKRKTIFYLYGGKTTFVTNRDTIEPLRKVKRWSSEKKIMCRSFASGNIFIGGVELPDQTVNNYRKSIRAKKLWSPLLIIGS